MHSPRLSLVIVFSALILIGCETTSTRPYTASTTNVMKFQNVLADSGVKVRLGEFSESDSIGKLTCRLSGPVDVAPGKTHAEYIKEAMQSELFMAQVYDMSGDVEIRGSLDALEFSSVSPANWTMAFSVSSDLSPGYTINTVYAFKTSFSAYSACKNVADAWGPAIQQLIQDVVDHPDFGKLAGL